MLSDRILLVGKVKVCLQQLFPIYVYKKSSGFQLRTEWKGDHTAIRVTYRITGGAVKRFNGREKRNAKLRNLREYTEHLLTNGFALSEQFYSNGKASYVVRQPELLQSRLDSFIGIRQNALLVADGQDKRDLHNLYLVSSFWYGEDHPEFRLKNMRYGVQLLDSYNTIEAANYGYRMIGVISDAMIDELGRFWNNPDLVHFDVNQKLSTRRTLIQWRARK